MLTSSGGSLNADRGVKFAKILLTSCERSLSLMLPSKSVPLNYCIRDFSNLLLDITCRLNRVFIIEHSMFGDILSDQHGRWMPSEISDEFVPREDDLLHLGRKGIRIFAKTMKQAVLRNGKTQPADRLTGGRGGYRRAMDRSRSHPGSQQP